ncbi:MAG: SRPBCC family protein [Oleiphilaceae bacterium]|nr:SRPBCC family protein [Oleiphilaceae bacterium]
MKTIVVRRVIPQPIDRVFDVLGDHEGYSAFPGVTLAKLLKQGRDVRNGQGAVRRIELGRVWFEEEITLFEPPRRMDYRILRSRPAIEHRAGSIRLEETGSGTLVTWTSTFRIKLPLGSPLVTPFVAKVGEKAFAGMLKAVEKKLRITGPPEDAR